MNVMRANFIRRLAVGADDAETKEHFIYSRILGTFAATQLTKSLSRQCVIRAYTSVYFSFDLIFIMQFPQSSGTNMCLMNACTQSLSEFLQATTIDEPAFGNVAEATARDPAVVQQELPQNYREIYLPGSQKRIFYDLSPADYQSAKFEGFSAWFARQQSVLRSLNIGKASP